MTKSLETTIINFLKVAEISPNGKKTLCEKEKLLIMSCFFFSHSFFNRLFLPKTRAGLERLNVIRAGNNPKKGTFRKHSEKDCGLGRNCCIFNHFQQVKFVFL